MSGRQQLLRAATKATAAPHLTRSAVQSSLPSRTRALSTSTPRFITPSKEQRNQDDPFHKSSSATLGRPGYDHEGSQARTDNTIVVEYPEESFPPEPTVQGRGGPHLRRTLASFSLEGRVGVITGGARGLGLVMAQSMVASGADIAIVDLNSTSFYVFNPPPPANKNEQKKKPSLPQKQSSSNSRKTIPTRRPMIEQSLPPLRKKESSASPTSQPTTATSQTQPQSRPRSPTSSKSTARSTTS